MDGFLPEQARCGSTSLTQILPTTKKRATSDDAALDSLQLDYFHSVVVGGLEVISSCTRMALSTSPEIRIVTHSILSNMILWIGSLFRMPFPSQLFRI